MNNRPDKDTFYIKTKHIEVLFKFIKNNKQEQFLDYISSLSSSDLDVNLRDSSGNYLINFAILMNNRLILTKLIEYGSRLDIIDSEGYGIMYHPIKLNYTDIIDILLKYNKQSLGISLVNIKDARGSVPLFYAIKHNNEYALQELLTNGADANYKNNDGINSLHLAIHKKNITMVRQIINYDKNIDAITNNGSSALHFAVSFGLANIVKLLVDRGANIDLVDYELELTPVFYSIIQNNLPISKMLIDNNANPNHQDIYGNTFCHYVIENNNHEMIDYIFEKYPVLKKSSGIFTENINSHADKNNQRTTGIDPMIVNYDGTTICHSFLYNYREHYDKYIGIILPKINLNYQDNKGNTILYLLVSLNIWSKFVDILQTKKLNIFIKNNANKTVYDVVGVSLRESFMDLVSRSYYNYLKKHDSAWMNEWENFCSKTDIDSADEKTCIEQIRKNMFKNNYSLPIKKNKKTIVIDYGNKVDFTTFTGSSLDLVCGFKYLTKKYKHVASILNSNQELTKELSVYYQSLGIQENSNQYLIQFEIKWIYQKIFIPPDFEQLLTNIIKNTKYKYIVIPVGIILSNGNHSNGLFYDIEKKQMERFEPHGSSYPSEFNYNPKLLDSTIEKKMNYIFSNIYKQAINIKYLKPQDYLPKIGFQTLENLEININKNIGDPNGFCTLWTIWYFDYRIANGETSPEKIIKILINNIKISNKSFRTIIRNYSIKVTQLRDEYLKLIDKNINDYLNNRVRPSEIKKLLIEIMSDNKFV